MGMLVNNKFLVKNKPYTHGVVYYVLHSYSGTLIA